MITWNKWLNLACLKLKHSLSPKLDAELLLQKVTRKSKIQLLTFGETNLSFKQIQTLQLLINRRSQGEPIAHIIGVKEFWSLNFKVSPGVFIPRPDTECLIEQILNLNFNSDNVEILDLGTGVGTIALTLASERPSWNITGIEQQKQALSLAHKNKLLLDCKNVNFIYGNWFKYLKNSKKFDLIVSNPPYINKKDLHWLSKDVYFEPRNALISKNSGLSDLMIICQYSKYYLCPSGWIFLEHGWNQGKQVRNLLSKQQFINICTKFDYNNCERITCGQWKPT
ncbi:protein methyltransferase HemK [Candidatus Blochmanniella vafra str. BVAF]|uniref:Release factor glutamine methyltransferase n=1 Tax=Blochmanniella vafra (strain BVAF) TaxID=859654 RepID=E8Q6Z9_BLOVB|nr:peptide chain release factor N(5)-glutamine methyltransferase [Candidatus Blochmannia vafer]ADV33746.1 protein methyltransferase HemK [Candidatus Blochmannia vafer str. BVAF]